MQVANTLPHTKEREASKAAARIQLLFADCITERQIEFLIMFICNEPQPVTDREIQIASHAYRLGYNQCVCDARNNLTELPSV